MIERKAPKKRISLRWKKIKLVNNAREKLKQWDKGASSKSENDVENDYLN